MPLSSPCTTTFYLAYPPAHSSSPFRWIKSRLLVQLLQQAERKKTLRPVFEILLIAPLGSRNWSKDVHCRSGDIALARGDFYADCTLPDGSRAEYLEDQGAEDDLDEKTTVIAVIRDQRKIRAGQYRQGQITDEANGPARFFFSCGAIWEAVTAQNGSHYQLVAVDSEKINVHGDYKLISWTRECPSQELEGNNTQSDVEFRLSIVDYNFRVLPLVATATRQKIQISYRSRKLPLSSRSTMTLQSTDRERGTKPDIRDSPFDFQDASFSEPLYLLCLVLTSAVWVASKEGWLNI